MRRAGAIHAPRTTTPESARRRLRQIVGELFREAADHVEARNPSLAAKLRHASPHWLRHTHATHALGTGVELVAVRDNLRHASIATTSTYLQGEDSKRARQVSAALPRRPRGRTAPRPAREWCQTGHHPERTGDNHNAGDGSLRADRSDRRRLTVRHASFTKEPSRRAHFRIGTVWIDERLQYHLELLIRASIVGRSSRCRGVWTRCRCSATNDTFQRASLPDLAPAAALRSAGLHERTDSARRARGGSRSAVSHGRNIAPRRLAEQAPVVPAELRGTFITDPYGRTGSVQFFA